MSDPNKSNPDEDLERAERSSWAETVKELTSAGLATIFMTEESVRSYLREKKFPKEVIGPLLDNMNKRKEDVYKVIGKEIGAFLGKLDLSKEASRFLENHRIQFEGKISFEPRKRGSQNASEDK